MKKAVIAILAFLYLTTASGVVMNIHYCMGHVASVSYGYDGHKGCGKCGMKETKGCCHTEYKVVKLQDEHQSAKASFINIPVIALVPAINSETIANSFSVNKLLTVTYHSPPDQRVNAVYLFNNVFRV